MFCMNSSDITWDYVFKTLMDIQNSNTSTAALLPDKLMDLSKTIQTNIVISLEDIQFKQSKAYIEQLIRLFLALYIDKIQMGCLQTCASSFPMGQKIAARCLIAVLQDFLKMFSRCLKDSFLQI